MSEFCELVSRKQPTRLFAALLLEMGGGPRVEVNTAAFHARGRGSVPDLGGLKETKNVSSSSTCESQYCGEPDRNQSSHHPQEVLLVQFSLHVHKGGLKPDSFHFIYCWRQMAKTLEIVLINMRIIIIIDTYQLRICWK